MKSASVKCIIKSTKEMLVSPIKLYKKRTDVLKTIVRTRVLRCCSCNGIIERTVWEGMRMEEIQKEIVQMIEQIEDRSILRRIYLILIVITWGQP